MKESENRLTKDRRVSRTLKKIREAYLELAKEKNPAKITVSELAAAAGINRKTFYMYYSGTEELLGEIADDLLEKYRELISGVELYSGSFEPLRFFAAFRSIVREDYHTYELLGKLLPTPIWTARTRRFRTGTTSTRNICPQVFLPWWSGGSRIRRCLWKNLPASPRGSS